MKHPQRFVLDYTDDERREPLTLRDSCLLVFLMFLSSTLSVFGMWVLAHWLLS
jgi:hypothetical protein